MTTPDYTSLRSYNTFGIDAGARYFERFSSITELQQALARYAGEQLLVLGGGSNVLFTKDYDGLVLKNELRGIELVAEDDDHFYVKAQAGENWHGFVLHCLQNGYAGVENLSLIPGNVGASPMQNIGAYGVEIKDVFQELEAWDLREQQVQTFGADACRFGYRESIFKKEMKGRFVILSVTYRLDKRPVFHTAYGAIEDELTRMHTGPLTIQAVAEAVIRIRSSKLPDPAKVGNAGSFFKNPVIPTEQYKKLQELYPAIPGFKTDESHTKVPAGWLIEQDGWKGFREGDAGCYPQQALVLVNYGQASGTAIYSLSEKIVQSVQSRFGIQLEREVNII